ncbi:lipase 1 [Aedes albopictus]|uniref:Lipase n=1 Tax=Aedes albopictus TaxID=7160 RepID=A0ABM1XVJ8_AEDAL
MSLSGRSLMVVLICALLESVHCAEGSWFEIDEGDGSLLIPDLISKYGYEVESHLVTTEDGYELTMFRILPRQPSETKKLPVLMVHGLMSSSVDFIIIGPNNSLAYLLADNGYDVWLANARGTRYSRKHSTLSVDSEEYWNFSFHEIGYYDLPAKIDYILNTTNNNKLQYVGFSQGTTVFFVMGSTRPEYNDKIALMIALSPAVLITRVRSPIVWLIVEALKEIKRRKIPYGDFEIIPHSYLSYYIAQGLCAEDDPENVCYKLISLLTGFDPDGYDQKLITEYIGHTPAGASINQIIHFAQVYMKNGFQQYDYGRKGNIQRYGTKKPPVYNLKLVTASILVYYGLNDWLVHPQDVLDLVKVLPRVIAAKQVADERFNHIDFVVAKNVRSLLYDQVIEAMEEYSQN